jgi:hypothetical protein
MDRGDASANMARGKPESCLILFPLRMLVEHNKFVCSNMWYQSHLCTILFSIKLRWLLVYMLMVQRQFLHLFIMHCFAILFINIVYAMLWLLYRKTLAFFLGCENLVFIYCCETHGDPLPLSTELHPTAKTHSAGLRPPTFSRIKDVAAVPVLRAAAKRPLLLPLSPTATAKRPLLLQ